MTKFLNIFSEQHNSDLAISNYIEKYESGYFFMSCPGQD